MQKFVEDILVGTVIAVTCGLLLAGVSTTVYGAVMLWGLL